MSKHQNSTIKVALIEDDPAIANMYRIKLEHEGMEVSSATDGLDAIELVSNFHPHIVLLDIMMTGSTGLEVLNSMRTRKDADDIKVIVLTNIDDTKLVQSMEDMGISAYLVKAEVTPADVVMKIHEVLGR